jgi:hypothetical protein
MAQGSQRRTIDLVRGLFLIRYAGAEDAHAPPRVTVSSPPTAQERLQFLLEPDQHEAVLWAPGACLVIRALASSQVLVEVEPLEPSGSISATVNIEPLRQGNGPNLSASRTHGPAESTNRFRILAHVAGRGDVYVQPNVWIAGPTSPSRIEGLSLEWTSKPVGIDINYSVRTGQPHSISGRICGAGAYAGTRGRALPLTGLLFELSGPDAPNHNLVAEALFLGAPVVRHSGWRVVLSGATGREPLVGLRLWLESPDAIAAPQTAVAQTSSPIQSSGRVRVFRGRSKTGGPSGAAIRGGPESPLNEASQAVVFSQ